MISLQTCKTIALSFPEVIETPHFEKTSFRTNKKIFATLSETDKKLCVKLSKHDQSVFCAFDKTVVYAVPNKWGIQGWTFVELNSIKKSMLVDVLTCAFNHAALKKNKIVAPQEPNL